MKVTFIKEAMERVIIDRTEYVFYKYMEKMITLEEVKAEIGKILVDAVLLTNFVEPVTRGAEEDLRSKGML
jgi:hypothetical protein